VGNGRGSPLVGVQDVLDLADGSSGQVVEFQNTGPLPPSSSLKKLHHHLAAPVVALDEGLAALLEGVAADGPVTYAHAGPL